MSQPYVGEIRLVGFTRSAPLGWAVCDGSLLPIVQYQDLFSLIGTTYGGDGQETFGLPDLRGRVPVHQGTGPGLSTYVLGQTGGTEAVALTAAQMPAHTHTLSASSAQARPSAFRAALLGSSSTDRYYGEGTPTTPMAQGALSVSGSGQAHDNMAPSLPMNYIIALYGTFPLSS
jgi:microcystin-dependent protein